MRQGIADLDVQCLPERPLVRSIAEQVAGRLRDNGNTLRDPPTTVVLVVEVSTGRSHHVFGTHPRTVALLRDLRSETVASLFAHGAGAVVSEFDPVEDLDYAVRAVGRGRKWLSPAVAAVMVEWLGHETGRPSEFGALSLTEREQQVLASLVKGLSIKQTARDLGIAPKTVEAHRSRVFAKLGARNSTQAITIAAEHLLVDPHSG